MTRLPGNVTSADGTTIHFETTGPGSGSGSGATALVFVHGWLGSCRWWDAQVEHFAGRYRVACLDLAGHGQSGKTRTEWSIAQYAADVRAVLGQVVFDTVIPRNVRVSEAPSHGKPVLIYDLKCVGSEAYLRLATEIIQREKELRAS